MIGIAGTYPQNWSRVCAALNQAPSIVVSSNPMIGVEAPARSSHRALVHTGRPCVEAPIPSAGPDLSDELTAEERRDDCYRSYYVALEAMRAR